MAFKGTSARREYFRDRKRKRYAEAVALLGGVCVKCGSTADLEIDHKDPETKLYEITSVLTYRLEIRLAELAKCQLLCNFHHEFKTARWNSDGDIPF